MKPNYIETAIPLPIENTFIYEIPETLFPFVGPGKRVLVPFGRRRVTGYVLGFAEPGEKYEIRVILDVLDEKPLFPPSMVPFFRWIADYYMWPLGEVIRSALPRGLNLYDYVTVSITEAGKADLSQKDLPPVQKKILGRLFNGPAKLTTLRRHLGRDIPNALIQTMERSGRIIKKKEMKQGQTKPKKERYISLKSEDIPFETLSEPKQKIITLLRDRGTVSVRSLKESVPTASRHIRPLEVSDYISVYEKNVYRDPFGEDVAADTPLTLTQEQEVAVSEIVRASAQGFRTYLLAGVTGSGKTEVYMQAAAEIIRRGKSVLILVPEIALISQMERRFRARFGERIALLHSRLSPGERYDQWMRIIHKDVSIAIGARSAVFAPFEDTGLIIVDEEHDTSYKQEGDFPYNARDIAVVRAKLSEGITVLGSATPSIQSYYNVVTEKFTELTLSERVEKRPMPDIRLADLKKIRDEKGIRRFITPELYSGMSDTLARGEQTLIFLNRRGFAGFPVCAACGEPITCENCDVTLTFHKAEKAYKCHYCGFTISSGSRCPICDSLSIKLLGLGTEKIESAIKTLFPKARVARMDRDTTTKKGSLLKILKDLRDRKTDILVGTQMVAKGHDFPNITLVGIICADLSLCHPDFRAGERTFQLLAQVSGRAGRGDSPGRVILQTYNPDHFSIASAVAQDFRAFYNKEILFRQALKYPPYSRLIQLKISGGDKRKTRDTAEAIGDLCQELHKRYTESVEVLGPVEASVYKVARRYRWQILLKGANSALLHRFVRRMKEQDRSLFQQRDVKVVADADPFFMF